MFVIRQQPSHFDPMYFSHPGNRCCSYRQQCKPTENDGQVATPNTTDRTDGTAPAEEKATAPRSFYRNTRAQVFEIDESIFLTLDLPGIKPDNVEIQVKTDLVSVTAQRQSKNGKAVIHYSKQFSVNERNVDTMEARASLVDGVLTVTLPKKEPEAPFNVPITSGSAPEADKETKDIRFDLELPGVKKSNLKITVMDGDLVIEGERTSGSSPSVTTRRIYGVNPKVVDASTFQAYLEDGVLTVTASRKEPVAAKTVAISTTAETETPAVDSSASFASREEETVVETVEEDKEEATADNSEESTKEWEQVLYEVEDETTKAD